MAAALRFASKWSSDEQDRWDCAELAAYAERRYATELPRLQQKRERGRRNASAYNARRRESVA